MNKKTTLETTNTRFYFMDSMRSVLMLLGVVLHSAQVYNPNKEWILYSDDSINIAAFIVRIIHVFRMPAFFVIAGFFCAFSLSRMQVSEFFKVKMLRILIPLLTTAIVLNSIQATVLDYSLWKPFDIYQYFLHGGWVSHLWFLIILLTYFFLASICIIVRKKLNLQVLFIKRTISKRNIILLLFLFPLFSIIVLALGKAGFPLYANTFGIIDILDAFLYLQYFIFGYFVYFNNDIFLNFSQINPIVSLIVCSMSFLIIKYNSISNNLLTKSVNVYFSTLFSWFLVSICFFVFLNYMNSPSKLWRFMSDASYSVYLFHQLFVVLISLIFLNYSLPNCLGLFILIVLSMSFPLLIHKYFILRIGILRLLFNGKL